MKLFDPERLMYEDELPDDMTDDEYSRWFDLSFVSFVRMGPSIVGLTSK